MFTQQISDSKRNHKRTTLKCGLMVNFELEIQYTLKTKIYEQIKEFVRRLDVVLPRTSLEESHFHYGYKKIVQVIFYIY